VSRKVSIPLTIDVLSPRVDAVRKRLGGRAASDAGVGAIVRLRHASQPGSGVVAGVVLFAKGDELDVMTDATRVRRTSRSSVEPVDAADAAASELAPIAADARVFAQLREGGVLEEGTLVEKCRYGAIVAKDDRALMGVGFRKIWPVTALPPS
jgi:hypothetical protein